jgi:hypothetical protein
MKQTTTLLSKSNNAPGRRLLLSWHCRLAMIATGTFFLLPLVCSWVLPQCRKSSLWGTLQVSDQYPNPLKSWSVRTELKQPILLRLQQQQEADSNNDDNNNNHVDDDTSGINSVESIRDDTTISNSNSTTAMKKDCTNQQQQQDLTDRFKYKVRICIITNDKIIICDMITLSAY